MTLTQQIPISSGFSATSTADEVLAGRSLAGLTALVAGGYSGLGLETTRTLAKAGARVIVPARRPDLASARLSNVPGAKVISLDLADLNSVARASGEIAATVDRLDFLIAAAGVMASPEQRVGPGWESQFATNHLGHFALVNRLFPLLARTEGARVVSYSSAGHHLSDIRWDDLSFGSGYDKWLAYGQSKTANVLFAVHFDVLGKEHGVRAFSLHPGSIITDLQRDMSTAELVGRGWIDENGTVIGAGFKTTEQGAATGVWTATSPDLRDRGGVYCENCDIATIASEGGMIDDGGVRDYAIDRASAALLWEKSAVLTGVDAFGTV